MTTADLHTLLRAHPERLAEVRRTAGLSQRGLAEVLGVGRSTLCHWEQGVCLPGPRSLRDLAAWWKADQGESLE